MMAAVGDDEPVRRGRETLARAVGEFADPARQWELVARWQLCAACGRPPPRTYRSRHQEARSRVTGIFQAFGRLLPTSPSSAGGTMW